MTIKARMGRPVDTEKNASILAAARSAFLEHSYDKVSMDSVALRALVSKVTIYSKFKSKDALFLAAMNEGCDAIFDQARFEAYTDIDISSTLRRFGEDFMHTIMSPEATAMHAVMIREADTHPALPRQFYETVVNRCITTLAETLSNATDKGAILCPDPRCAAIQFIAMVQGNFRYQLELRVLTTVDYAAISEYVATCVALFVRGYRAEE